MKALEERVGDAVLYVMMVVCKYCGKLLILSSPAVLFSAIWFKWYAVQVAVGMFIMGVACLVGAEIAKDELD